MAKNFPDTFKTSRAAPLLSLTATRVLDESSSFLHRAFVSAVSFPLQHIAIFVNSIYCKKIRVNPVRNPSARSNRESILKTDFCISALRRDSRLSLTNRKSDNNPDVELNVFNLVKFIHHIICACIYILMARDVAEKHEIAYIYI